MAILYTTGTLKCATSSKSVVLGLLRTAEGRECVYGPKSRQGGAAVVKKLKIYIRSAKVCVSGNALLVVKPRDGALQELRLLVVAPLWLELCGWESVSWPCRGLCTPSSANDLPQ